MMYSKHFSVAVRVNGKILRENQGIVNLPFGVEYEILLKNLNSRRAMVKVSVDGTDATDGTRLILQPNASVTLERFIKNGNLSAGNRFKFIERTTGIESHRGIKVDDGLVRVEFWQEREVVDSPIVRRHYYDEWYPVPRPYPIPKPRCVPVNPWYEPTITYTSGGSVGNASCNVSNAGETGFIYGRTQGSGSIPGQNIRVTKSTECQTQGAQQMYAMNMAQSDAGITVPGSESNQQFHHASGFQLETNSTVIVLQLRGEVGGVAVAQAVTVERKPDCSSCGKTNKATSKFCTECGTALQLI